MAANALRYARQAAEAGQHSFIGTEHILLGLAKEEDGLAHQVLTDHGITSEKIAELMDQLIRQGDAPVTFAREYTPRCRQILENAGYEAEKFGQGSIGTEHLLIAIIKESTCVGAQMLATLGARPKKIYQDILLGVSPDSESLQETQTQSAQKQSGKNKDDGLLVERYSRDLTALAREGKLDPVIGREAEIQRIMQILSRRTKNNPCLIGEPGVGKTAVCEGLAQRIASGEVPDMIAGKRILSLDVSGMVAGTKYRGEFEERIKRIISEVEEDRDILLFIDEIHTIIGAGGAEGSLDAANILKPSLARGHLQVIGATTIEEYRRHIEKDAALERRFAPVTIEQPSEDETLLILKGLRPAYEGHHQVRITDDALEAAARLSSRYIGDRFLPDKAIDLIDEAASRVRLGSFQISQEARELREQIRDLEKEKEEAIASQAYERAGQIKGKQQELQEKLLQVHSRREEERNREKLLVTQDEIADIVAAWTGIPVRQLQEEEMEKLRLLEDSLHQRVVGQDEAVTAVAKSVRRGRVGLKDPGRPVGSFLFLGPTGVGKTELSKALAQVMFGREDAMIRIDMSEYMEKHSVSKLIGSPPGYVGYDEGGQLSEKVRRNPYSVLLFDEIEKAHPDVFNILLQILDDGRLTDSQGRKVDFKNTVIIMTSNAGAAQITANRHLGFSAQDSSESDYQTMKSRIMEEVRRMFKPEFLNRIDEIMVFRQLTRENVQEIAGLMLQTVRERVKQQLDIDLTVSQEVRDHLAQAGFSETYGARPLRRAIQTQVEDMLAESFLEGTIRRSSKVRLDIRDGKIVPSAE